MQTFTSPRFGFEYPPNTVVRDLVDKESGLRMLVTRGGYSFCCYVGVRASHDLAGLKNLNFRCRRPIGFRDWGRVGSPRPEGYFWWGWDYTQQHATTPVTVEPPRSGFAAVAKLDIEPMNDRQDLREPQTLDWSVSQVVDEGWAVLMHLKQVLSESGAYSSLLLSARLST